MLYEFLAESHGTETCMSVVAGVCVEELVGIVEFVGDSDGLGVNVGVDEELVGDKVNMGIGDGVDLEFGVEVGVDVGAKVGVGVGVEEFVMFGVR